MSNERKLMPYEHQLVDALGISKQEYLDFVAQQQVYSDPKEGTILDIRNDPATLLVISTILIIVGTILQVVGALLLKDDKPSGVSQSRDDVFAPRSGFNSVQELARYGDPINLVYTNINTNSYGGVRVATSLLWSSVKSYGSSQYVQLLLLIGAGGVGEIDADRSAFGQTPLRDLIAQNYWLYFKPNGTGEIRPSNLLVGSDSKQDPAIAGAGNENIYRLNPSNQSKGGEGFSHAISPSTSNRFGVYAPVPINLLLETRNEDGDLVFTYNGISASGSGVWGEDAPRVAGGFFAKGVRLYIYIRATNTGYQSQTDEDAKEFRRTVASAFDEASVMKLGAAQFAITNISNSSTDDGAMTVSLICSRAGRASHIWHDTLTRNRTQGPVTDLFFTKAIVKVETAKYETISPCHIVDFAIKGRVSRRISGRQEAYGREGRRAYASADNGVKHRSAMFTVKYGKKGGPQTYVKGIFVMRRAAEVDNFVYLRFDSRVRGLENAEHWRFDIEPIHDPIAEFGTHSITSTDGKFRYFYLENFGSEQFIGLGDGSRFSFIGSTVESADKLPPRNSSPWDSSEWDLFSNTSDTQLQTSFDQGPEFAISAVTEQIAENYAEFSELYNDLSLAGFNMYSGRNVQDLRSLSMFVNEGRRCRLVRTSGIVNGISWGQPDFGPYYLPSAKTIGTVEMVPGTSYYITSVGNSDWSAAGLRKLPVVGEVFVAKAAVPGTGQVKAGGHANRAPDIFLDTILDGNDGIGKYSGDLFAVDIEQLARSKKFCERNKLFMDGLIAQPESWRQFWANNAAFSLLELAKIDGKEALIPGVPYDKRSGKIASKETLVTVPIAALFNQGNILEGSYKEEFVDYGTSTEDVIVTVIYRDNERDGVFPRKNSVEVKLQSADEDSAIRETIDASQFVTRRDQSILLGKLLCQTRRHVRRAVEFKTFPSDSYIGPSAYIYVELAQNQWDKIYSGTIGEGGELNLPIADAVKNGDYQFLMYNPNSNYGEGTESDKCPEETEDSKTANGTLFRSAIAVVDGRAEALKGREGYVFVLGKVIRSKRTFRVTEVSMDEEGEVTVRAVEHPTDADGYSLITRGLTDKVDRLFMIDGRPE